ncbi:unnamed protein product [Adineta ricciae]|uniref:SecA family profile domain-containing protein n=1 Tax=Adineta ricciae TaxID=249248 RepID=A0A814UY03_ADIRI|nr:unnamed protein product [Adineta ricciae]CAF1181635.1 unnamed protein product [Adineta ricciae]
MAFASNTQCFHYEPTTIQEDLINQIRELSEQNPEWPSVPIHVFDVVDDNNSDQLEQKLRDDIREHFEKRIILIPYHSENSNHAIILIEFQDSEHILRAEFIGSNAILDQLQTQLNKVYSSVTFQKKDWIYPNDSEVALKRNIEHLISTVEGNQHSTMINSQIHLLSGTVFSENQTSVSISQEGNENELGRLNQQLSSRLVELKIRDVNLLPEKIKRAQEYIKDCEDDGRAEEADKEKERLRKLGQLKILVDKISQLDAVESNSTECSRQVEFLRLQEKLSSSLARMKIQDEKSLLQKIKKAKERINDFQDDNRVEEAEKESEYLGKLQEIQQLMNEVAKFNSDMPTLRRIESQTETTDHNILRHEEHHGVPRNRLQQTTTDHNEQQPVDVVPLTETLPNVAGNEQMQQRLHPESDLTRIPYCAERTIMELLKHCVQKSAALQDQNFLTDMLSQLDTQMKQQELFSFEVKASFESLRSAICSGTSSNLMNRLQVLLRKIRPINIDETQILIDKSKDAAHLIRDKDVVLLIGETGSGKSTTIHFLAGSHMQEVQVPIESNKFLRHIAAVEPIHNLELKNVTSSPFHKSETRYIAPVTIELENVPGIRETGVVILCDAPGFGDTAGAEVDIANSVGILEGLVGARSVKLLVLSNFQNLGKRGEGIQRLAHIVINMVSDIAERLDSIIYGFTQYPEKEDINTILVDIMDSRVNADPRLKSDPAFVTVLKDMIDKTEETVYRIDPIHGDRKVLLKKLKRMKGILFPETAFRFSISEETRATIASHVELDRYNIICAVNHKNNELVLYYLNDLKMLQELTKQNVVRDAYERSVRCISETIDKCCTDKKEKFNRALNSQDGLKEDDISEYKNSVEYLQHTQILKEHLGSSLSPPEMLVQNIIFQLNQIKSVLIKNESYNPFVRVYLNNLSSLRMHFFQLETYYTTSCSEFKVSFDELVKSSKKLIPTNNFKEIAERILSISKSSEILKDHCDDRTEAAYYDLIEALLKHLNSYCEKADCLLKKNRLNPDDTVTLQEYMEILTSAKENSALKDCIAPYTNMFTTQISTSRQDRFRRQDSEGFFKDINAIHRSFVSRIVDYFNAIKTRIEELFRRQKDHALDDIHRLITDMDAIRSIPELESKTVGIYYCTVESINTYMKEFQIEAENLVVTMNNQSGTVNYRSLAFSLSRIKNADWIDRISPGTYDNLIRRVTVELVEQACRLESSLLKIDCSLTFPDNVCKAYDIVEKIESMSHLENTIPELEKFRKNIIQRFLQSIQAVFDRIQSIFDLQDKDVDLIKQKLNGLEQTKKEFLQLHPASVHLRKHNYSDIHVLDKEIEQLIENRQAEVRAVETEQHQLTDKVRNVNTVISRNHRLSLEINESPIENSPNMNTLPTNNLTSLGYSCIDDVYRDHLGTKDRLLNISKQNEEATKEFNNRLRHLRLIKVEYQSLLENHKLMSSEEMSFLKTQGFESVESLDEVIREKMKVINERGQKQTYYFSKTIDASTANSALIYLHKCEEVSDDRVRTNAIHTNENLRKYLFEYGKFLDQVIRNKFDSTKKIPLDNDICQHSQELSMHLQELTNLERYSAVFECIKGKDKIDYWHITFSDFHRNLTHEIQIRKQSFQVQELKDRLTIAHALSYVDRFCDSGSSSMSRFETLYIQYHTEEIKECRQVYGTILDHIEKEEYAKADIALSNIKEGSLNAKDLAQIEHDLKSSLNKLISQTKSTASWLNGKIEKGDESNQSKIRQIKENSDKVRIAANKHRIFDLVDDRTRNSLAKFDQDMSHILSTVLLRGIQSIQAFIDTNSFSEAEQGMENLCLVQHELTDYYTSEEVQRKTDELRNRLDNVVNQLLKENDFADISNFSSNPPRALLEKLIMVPPHVSSRFNQVHKTMSDRIRNSFSSAISVISGLTLKERTEKVRGLKQALCFLPDDMQTQFRGQIEELINQNVNEERTEKQHLNDLLKRVQVDDNAISQLGLLAEHYKSANMHELLQILREQCLKELHRYRTEMQTSDIESTVQVLKKIVKYKKSLGIYVPEALEFYSSVSKMILKNFLDCCENLANISSIEQSQSVEKAFENMVSYLRLSVTLNEQGDGELFSIDDLGKANDSVLEMSKYLKENSVKFQSALNGMNVTELYKTVIISKKYDKLLQNIKRCSSIHELVESLRKDMKSVISYSDMISNLETFANSLKSQLKVELINDVTTKFEIERDAFFQKLMKLIDTYRSFSSKFDGILSTASDVGKMIEDLKQNIDRISQQLLTKASRLEHFSANDSDEFRMYYNHLRSFQKHVHIPEINISHVLNQVEEKVFDKIHSLQQEIYEFYSETERVAKVLCRMKFFAENLSMFDTYINTKIDEALKMYKDKEGSIGITNLTVLLEREIEGARIISEHSCLSGEDRRKRRERMQKQDDIEYALSELKGDTISEDILRSRYRELKKRYDTLIAENLAFFSKNGSKEPDVQVLVTQIKFLVGTVKHEANSISWSAAFVDQIPELLAHIFALWTLQNTEHYNTMRGIRADQAYLLMPHVGQIIAIFRLLGIGYKSSTILGGTRLLGTKKISSVLTNNLVELGTGEGKSVVLAITACVFALTGIDVNCSCYSEVLSTRDKNDFTSVFRTLGIEEYIEYGTFNKLCEQVLNERCNVREKVCEMVLMNQSMIANSDTSRSKRPKVLLIDEVDVFLSDRFYGGIYTPSVCLNKEHEILALLDSIWQNKNELRVLRDVTALLGYQQCALKYFNWMFLFDEAIKDMLAALKSFQSSTYIVQNDKIVYVEGESIVDNVVRGYDTIWAYYYEHEKGNISRESLQNNVGIIISCGTISYAEMPHEFSYIAGVTGTLKTLATTEVNILKEIYKIAKMTYIPSVYGSSNRTYDSRSDVREVREDEYFMEIRNEIDTQRNASRAILIFFESEEKLIAFYNSSNLSSLREHVQIITEKVSAKDRDMYVKRAATEGRVTLLTRTFGRGTDFICRTQKLLSNGGIHVLQTFFSEEPSEEYQIMGRGARQGDRGSYRMILLGKDLEWVLGSIWREKLNDIQGPLLYAELKKARDALYESKCSAKHLGIQQRKKEHTATKDFMNALLSKDILAVKNFLGKQNKGVALIVNSSRTILLMDATGSMSGLLTAAKETVCTMFERATAVLDKQKTPNNGFEMQMTAYRDYDCMKEGLLQSSSWESKPTNLRSFISQITATGGEDYPEAIEIGLWHAVQQSNTPEGIAQVILIGDAPAKDETAIKHDRMTYGGEAYWNATSYRTPTHYAKEVRKLKEKDIPIHTFYLNDGARMNFEEIARETSGHCKRLDIHSTEGAELLTHFVTEEILRKTGGEDAAKLYQKMFVKKSFLS